MLFKYYPVVSGGFGAFSKSETAYFCFCPSGDALVKALFKDFSARKLISCDKNQFTISNYTPYGGATKQYHLYYRADDLARAITIGKIVEIPDDINLRHERKLPRKKPAPSFFVMDEIVDFANEQILYTPNHANIERF